MTDEFSEEALRLGELIKLSILDTPPERAYDEVTRMAAEICGTPISVMSLIDEHRQWFKSAVGLELRETPRHQAFCAHAIRTPGQMLVVPDALQDPRFAQNALVTGEPNIRFYAGAPLVTSRGFALGTLCVIDQQPRELTETQCEYIVFLAREVVNMIEAYPPIVLAKIS